jgi:hypothetical protein
MAKTMKITKSFGDPHNSVIEQKIRPDMVRDGDWVEVTKEFLQTQKKRFQRYGNKRNTDEKGIILAEHIFGRFGTTFTFYAGKEIKNIDPDYNFSEIMKIVNLHDPKKCMVVVFRYDGIMKGYYIVKL